MFEIETLITLMANMLQPDRQISPSGPDSTSGGGIISGLAINAKLQYILNLASDDPQLMSRSGAQSPGRYDDPMHATTQHHSGIGIMSRLNIAKNGQNGNQTGNSVVPLFLSLTQPHGGLMSIPAHPAGLCLETMLSFFLLDNIFDVIVGDSCQGTTGRDALITMLTSVLVTVSSMMSEGLAVDANVR
jgi:hypothetical protein